MKAWVCAEFSLRSISRMAVCLLALCCVLASESGAAVVIDEVLVSGSATGRSSELPSVKLYNSGPASVGLAGWRITDRRASAGELYTFPAATLAAGQYAVVLLGTGSDDLDASDGVIHLFTGVEASFESDDAAALYQGPAIAANLRDFVAWSSASSPVTGDAMDDAVAVAQWLAADWVDISAMSGGGSLARLPSGYDTNSPNDWGLLELAARMAQSDSSTQNPVQIAPQHGQVFLSNLVTFSFIGPAWAEKYNLQVDNDSDFSSPEINQEFSPPSLAGKLASTPAATLGAGIYYYRVRVKPPGHPYLTEAAVWIFAIDDAGAPAASGGVQIAATEQTLHGVARRLQHKDSRLVCIWDQNAFGGGAPSNQNPRGRPGCDPFRFAGQAWDAAHAETAAHVGGCGHCAFYCARACTQMLNHFYGGNLLQDRISYHIRNGDLAGPEGDLGHDRGFSDGEVTTALNWALQVAGATYTPYFGAAKATFAQYKAYLANGPVVAGVPNHVVVADGWRETTIGALSLKSIHIQDPWPGNATGWFMFNVWINRNDAVWSLPAGNKVGRNNEAAVTADGDGDGLMDFDEQNPRPFCSLSNDLDTEDDEVNDKREVEAYTFHEERDHAGHDNDAAPVGFADVDGDGLRSECDCDSDNDSDFDGGEDIDGDGDGGMGGWPETDMFLDPHTLLVFTDKKVYYVGETVKLTGWDLHRTSTYPYDIIAGCPDLVDGQGLGQVGTVTTNAFGRFPWTDIFVCPEPKTYLAVVDVLKDHLYSEPDNWDPWTCFTCIQPCYPPSIPTDPCTPRIVPPGEVVTVNAAVVTGHTVSGPPGVYVQDPNSSCGLRVTVNTTAQPGELVCFQGVRTAVGCEPAVTASEFTVHPYSVSVEPLFMVNRDIGGIPLPGTQPIQDPYGPNNTCSLIKTSGRVIFAPPFSPEIVISDGSTLNGQHVMVKVMLGPWADLLTFQEGELLTVTGISSGDTYGRRAIIIRTPQDIGHELSIFPS